MRTFLKQRSRSEHGKRWFSARREKLSSLCYTRYEGRDCGVYSAQDSLLAESVQEYQLACVYVWKL